MIEESAENEMSKICEWCGDTKGVSFGPDPYAEEIYGDDTGHWLCDSCCHSAAMDV